MLVVKHRCGASSCLTERGLDRFRAGARVAVWGRFVSILRIGYRMGGAIAASALFKRPSCAGLIADIDHPAYFAQ